MRVRSIIGLILLSALLSGCGAPPQASPSPTSGEGSAPPGAEVIAPIPTPAPDPVEIRLDAMSTEEKIGQLLVAGIDGPTPGEDGPIAVQDYKVGGIIFFRRNMESAAQMTALIDGLKALNGGGVPLFLGVDEEGGAVSRMPEGVDALLSPYDDLAAGGDPYRRGEVLGERCTEFGFNLNFAPVLDVWSNPENTVIGKRAFSSDWDEAAAAGAACAKGLLDKGIIPVVKHFPGHGDTLADSHKTLPVVKKSLSQLMEEELVPFRAAIDEGLPAVMVAHILMEELDPVYPATLSSAVVDGLLRGELGFDGMVVTDDLTMGAVANTYSIGEAAVLAVEAGCDLLLVCHKTENLAAAYSSLLGAVASGRISGERLDESVRRILRVKDEYGLTNGEDFSLRSK